MSNKNNMRRLKEGGYALVTALIFLLAGGSAVVAGLSEGVLREVRTIRNESHSKQGYFASESALEDALYRITTGKDIDSTESVTLSSSTASVSVVSNADGSQTIVSDGVSGGTIRSTSATLEGGDTIAFNYALQTGVGGIELASGISITGDVYTAGSIISTGPASISGMAIAGEVASLTIDQENSSPATPAQSIVFGNTASNQDFAQSFRTSQNSSLMKIALYIKKTGNPTNATIKITASSGSNPNYYTPLASGTLSSSLVSTSYEWVEITLTSNPILSANTTYWIVVDANANVSSYYTIAANSTYANGQAKVGRGDWSSWNNTTPSGLDGYFKAWLGTTNVGILGASEWNRLSVGSAYANQVSYVNASGALYCQSGGYNNKVCDTSRADPVIQEMPLSDDMVQIWKDAAESGGSSGSQTVGYAGATIGPRKINGNLSVGGGGMLNVSGMIWVTGNVTIAGGSKVQSADSDKSFVIIADGSVTLSGGAEILGGDGSHVMLLSTSTADPAITIDGGANDTLVFAPDGIVRVSGGTDIKAIAAKKVYLSGGASLVYDPEMSQLNLAGGSEGVPLHIKTWKEVE